MSTLPPSSDITDNATTEGQAKTWLAAVRTYISQFLGTAGTQSEALSTIGAPMNGTLTKSGAYTVVAGDRGKVVQCAGSFTLAISAAATLGDGFSFTVMNVSTGIITIDPNLSETIDGYSTLNLSSGASVFVYCDGVSFRTVGISGSTPTGSRIGYVGSTAPSGWVLASGRTIGSATSGATERANADCQPLFELLWNSMAQSEAAVSGGRGASAAADWSANKTIALPDYRGRTAVGRDNMGSSAASRMTSGGSGINGATLGASGGSQTHTLSESQMPSHTHGMASTGIGGNAALYMGGFGTWGIAGGAYGDGSTGGYVYNGYTGGSGAHQNTQPSIVENVIIKL